MRALRSKKITTAAVATIAMPLLLGCQSAPQDPAVTEEIARREEFRVHTLDVEGAVRAKLVSSRPDVLFEEEFSRVLLSPPSSYRNHAFRWMGRRSHVRLKTHGDREMSVRALGWLDRATMFNKPFVSFYIDGQIVHETKPTEDGHYWAEFPVPAELLRNTEWVDLIIAPSSIAFHWAAPPNLAVAVLYRFEWEEQLRPVTPTAPPPPTSSSSSPEADGGAPPP